MLNLEQVDKKHGVALSGLSKAGEIVLTMAAFLPNEKLSGVIVMNSVMNYFMQDVMYKGKQVLAGNHGFKLIRLHKVHLTIFRSSLPT